MPKWISSITAQMFQKIQGELAHVDTSRPAMIVTIFLTGLLTPAASPHIALGAGGVDTGSALYSTQIDKTLFQTPQQDAQGNDLCVDHSAMKIPDAQMREVVYQQQLMHTPGLGFAEFGVWPL